MKTKRESFIPNSTQVPNVVMDMIMPRIPAAHERCLRYVCRRTFGFGKKSDRIGLNQFVNGIRSTDGEVLDYGAGVAYTSAREALEDLEFGGILLIDRTRTGRPNGYRLKLENVDPEDVVSKIAKAIEKRNKAKKGTAKQPSLFNSVPSDNPAAYAAPLREGGTLPAAQAAETLPQVRATQKKVEIKKKERAGAAAPALPNRFQEYLVWYADLATRARSLDLPLKITAAGKSNLGRFLREYSPSWDLMEQLALYFLVSPRYKKFGPGIETFLSAGIINGLLNDARNDADFWKNLESYLFRFLKTVPANYENVDFSAQVAALSKAFSVGHNDADHE